MNVCIQLQRTHVCQSKVYLSFSFESLKTKKKKKIKDVQPLDHMVHKSNLTLCNIETDIGNVKALLMRWESVHDKLLNAKAIYKIIYII